MELSILLPLAGFVVGLVVGMTGVGGGSLMTPALIFGLGVPPAVAVGTDLVFAGLTKSIGVWAHSLEKTSTGRRCACWRSGVCRPPCS